MNVRALSVRARLTLWYMGALSFLLLSYACGVYAYVRHQFVAALDEGLHQDFEVAEEMLELDAEGGIRWRESIEDPDSLAPELLEVRGEDGALLLQLRDESPPLGDSVGSHYGPESVPLPTGVPVRLMSRTMTIGGRPVVVLIARTETRLRHELGELLLVLATGVPIGVALAGLGGYLLARRALAPVDRITERAELITAERLSERLPVLNPSDELGRLATVFNDAFARLEASFEQLRRFTADASHELRTPLTAMRSVGEVALRERRGEEEYREVIGSMLEEVDRLATLVDSLLTLSRADGGHALVHRESIDLSQLVRDVVAQVSVLSEEKRQTLEVTTQGPILVAADRGILWRAVINLLDNAIKYSPLRAHVRVMVTQEPGAARVTIVDHGPGIEAAHLPHIFDRFYRVDKARSRELGGVGLGLAIAKWAVEAHGGTIEVESVPKGGSTFRITLPMLSAGAPA
jgi:heavy metal sensor kinase